MSRSEEEMEELVGEDGGGTNSVAGSSILVKNSLLVHLLPLLF